MVTTATVTLFAYLGHMKIIFMFRNIKLHNEIYDTSKQHLQNETKKE